MPPKILLLLLLFFCPAIVISQVSSIQLKFENGQVKSSFKSANGTKTFILDAVIPTTYQSSNIQLVSSDSTGIVVRKQLTYFNHTCDLTSTVKKTGYGLQWDIEITAKDTGSWTAPIETSLQWMHQDSALFWTTWADNHTALKTDTWHDPFSPAHFQDLALTYGGETHLSRNAFVIPIASTFFNKDNLGLSFLQSLDDTILDLEMHTTADGKLAYRHINHRINSKHSIHIRHQIVLHEADWRDGIAWMAKNYKAYFFPEEPIANDIAGCAAYSSYEGELDTAKYRKMAFSINWKASLDFPYMGMFIPPVKSKDEKWVKYKQRGVQVDDGYTTINQLNKYSGHLNQLGFHTISYFNVNEFGNGMVYPYKTTAVADDSLWKNPNNFVYTKLKKAFLKPAGLLPDWDDRPLFSNWEDCIVLDPADSVYKSFLLNQASLHIKNIPASSGICIDRLDWMRFYNANGDDHISMVDRQKTQSLLISWKNLMDPLSRIMHNAHKVIFCNPLDRRIDLMAHIDGIYDEFGYMASSLNLCAQMAFFKPIIAWTASKENLMPDPDAYFQRHLYLGAFLTAPYPGNDHCIQPDAWAEKYYTDYGPLLSAIKGREWLLIPHIVQVIDGPAKANAFKGNGKVIIPIVLGGSTSKVPVIVRLPFAELNKKKLQIKVLYPGETKWKPLKNTAYTKTLELNVPMKRGCALISII
ncbi:hypothetical protein SAMN05192574_10790 [Mucilaginibacter gossypiicola]|uniref:Uncharacterized protein n=1 Tax=Mucilaginibacter gossypiicola TaxID=551995 RepID=A0A1H8NTM0_9SPHI|nr:hypothetical protein [Mucilaginibacter gossypiicola]SEO32937.1 hypothetical protein SAMN05192574_10790 [Mucilaginibacter gossypiicola]